MAGSFDQSPITICYLLFAKRCLLPSPSASLLESSVLRFLCLFAAIPGSSLLVSWLSVLRVKGNPTYRR